MPPCSVRGWYLYIHNRETGASRLEQTPAWPHCCGFMVSELEYKMNEGKTQAIYFPRRRRMHKDDLQLNGRNIPFVNSAEYLGIIFDRRLTLRLHIENTSAKALGTYIRTYSVFKSNHLSANIKLIVYRALLKSIMTYACPTWEFAKDIHLMKLQRLQNRVLLVLAGLTGAQQSAICT
jgi:hypothetical protein